jgi:tetratricopeptide (TPR) repeat protein
MFPKHYEAVPMGLVMHQKLLTSLLIVIFTALPAFGNEIWASRMKASKDALMKKDYKLAEQETMAARKEAQQFGEADSRYIATYAMLGTIHMLAGQYAEAENVLRKGLEIVAKNGKTQTSDCSALHLGLALVHQYQQQYAEASAELTLAFSTLKDAPGSPDPDYVPMLITTLEQLHLKLGHGQGQDVLLSEALAVLQRYGFGREKQAGIVNLYQGDLLIAHSKFEEAEAKIRKAIEILTARKQEKLLLLANIKLGQLFVEQSRFSDANKLFADSLATAEKTAGPKDEQYGTLLLMQGQLLAKWEKPEEALAKVKAAMAVLERDPDSYQMSLCWRQLALLYDAKGMESEAEDASKKAIAIAQKVEIVRPEEAVENYNVLSVIYLHRHKYSDAQKQLELALAFAEKHVPKSESTAKIYSMLGNLYNDQGKYAQAKKYGQKALDLRTALFGWESPIVVKSMTNLGACYRDSGQNEQAEQMFDKSMQIAEKVMPPDDPRLAIQMISYALGQNKRGKFSEADDLFVRALAIREKAFGQECDAVALTLVAMARNNFDAGKYADAETRAKRALSIDEKIWGKNSCQVARDLDLLKKIYKKVSPDKIGTVEERADKIKAILPGAPPAEIMKNPVMSVPDSVPTLNKPIKDKWALVIGISNFKDPSINLKYAAKDATDFANFLMAQEGFDKSHVKVLTDQDATRANIVDAVGEVFLAAKAKPDDLVVIYVSSHGGGDLNKSSGLNFLVAYDANPRNLLANGIPMEWFSQIIKDEVKSERVVVFLDVCHSGAAADGKQPADSTAAGAAAGAEAGSASGGKGLRRTQGFDVMTMAPGQNQIFICSSLSNQLSWESKKYLRVQSLDGLN